MDFKLVQNSQLTHGRVAGVSRAAIQNNMTSITASKSSGCHKCGQRGHWARDCTNASSAAIQTNGTDERPLEEVGMDGQDMCVFV